MTTMTAPTAPTADPARTATTTKRLFYAASVLAGLVVVPMLVLAAYSVREMQAYPDEMFAGIGIVFAIFFAAPSLVGLAVSAFALPWRTKSAGTVIAAIGLAITALSALWVASFFVPTGPFFYWG